MRPPQSAVDLRKHTTVVAVPQLSRGSLNVENIPQTVLRNARRTLESCVQKNCNETQRNIVLHTRQLRAGLASVFAR